MMSQQQATDYKVVLQAIIEKIIAECGSGNSYWYSCILYLILINTTGHLIKAFVVYKIRTITLI